MNAVNAYYPEWEQVPGCALDIASAGDSTWIIGCENQPGIGHTIKRWNGFAWDQVPGAAERITVNPLNGEAWVVDQTGGIHYSTRQPNGTYVFAKFNPGCATDIAFSPNGFPVIRWGSPWIVGLFDNNPWNFAEQAAIPAGNATPSSFGFNKVAGRSVSRVAVGSTYVWFAGSTIYRLLNN